MMEGMRRGKENRNNRRRKVTASAESQQLNIKWSVVREIKLNLNKDKLNPMFDNNLKN